MPGKRDLIRLLIDTFDVDIQLYASKALQQAANMPSAQGFVTWAKASPNAFETLLRVVSAAAQRMPRDQGALMNTLRDQLTRLPLEAHRAILSDRVESTGQSVSSDQLSESAFETKYETALDGLSDEDMSYIATLSSDRLREWVLSPTRIRPHKLRAWRTEEGKDSIGVKTAKHVARKVDAEVKDVQKMLEEATIWLKNNRRR